MQRTRGSNRGRLEMEVIPCFDWFGGFKLSSFQLEAICSPLLSFIFRFSSTAQKRKSLSPFLFCFTQSKTIKIVEVGDMFQRLHSRSSYKDAIKDFEADIQHANALAAAIPRVYGGSCLHMRLSCSPFAPIFLFFTQWMDCSYIYELPSYLGLLYILVYKLKVDGNMPMSSHDRKASLKEFYAVIYPSLQQLQGDLRELEKTKQRHTEMFSPKRAGERRAIADKDSEREDECGICMEACTKMVMPDCGHAMCMRCYHDWNMRSKSCPFCRGSLKRVSSEDLWVLTSNDDVIDLATLAVENLRRFYIYIDSLPLLMPDNLFYVYDYII